MPNFEKLEETKRALRWLDENVPRLPPLNYVDKHKEFRNFVKKNRRFLPKLCQVCKSKKNLDVHHHKYENDIEALLVVCRKHHRELHQK